MHYFAVNHTFRMHYFAVFHCTTIKNATVNDDGKGFNVFTTDRSPYCELLEISSAKVNDFSQLPNVFRKFYLI